MNQEMEIGELQIENEQLFQENTKLQDEIERLRTQEFQLKHLCNVSSKLVRQQILSKKALGLSALSLKNDAQAVCFYTGLPNYEVFEQLYQLLEPLLSKDNSKSVISLFDELLIVLVKLRLGVPNEDLGYRFGVSSSWVSVIYHNRLQ